PISPWRRRGYDNSRRCLPGTSVIVVPSGLMALRLLALVGLLTAAPRALAIDHDMAVWTALVGAVETDSALIASFETHVRRDGARSTALLRPAVGVRLADHWSTHAGYALI